MILVGGGGVISPGSYTFCYRVLRGCSRQFSLSVRTTPPYRAEHVGSLLRPKRLLEARAEHAVGTLSAERLRNEEDAAIRAGRAGRRDLFSTPAPPGHGAPE